MTNKFGRQKFSCGSCSLEFDSGKYSIENKQDWGEVGILGRLATDWYLLTCKCPTCGSDCYAEKSSDKPPYWTLNYDW